MLVPLFLYEKEQLSSPMFYLSAYLEQHRDMYQYRLRMISEAGTWNGWVAFFLGALVDQARENRIKTQEILLLYERMKLDIPKATRSQYAIKVVDTLFGRPIFGRADFVRESGIPPQTARHILDQLKGEGIVQVLRPGKGRRPNVLAFPELLRITKE